VWARGLLNGVRSCGRAGLLNHLGLDPPAGRADRGLRQLGGCCRAAPGPRAVAITVVLLSAITNFLFIPYPIWALLIITLDIFVIWAVAAHGRDINDATI